MNFRPAIVGLGAIGLVVLLLVGILGVAGAASYQSTASTTAIANQSITVDYTHGSNLTGRSGDHVEHFDDNETIVANNSTLQEGSDYSFNTTTGHITWHASSGLTNGTAALASFHYRGRPSATYQMTAVQHGIFTFLPWLLLVLVALFITGLLFAFGYVAVTRGRTPNIGR